MALSTPAPADSTPPLRTPAYARGHWFWGYGLALLRQPLQMFVELRDLGDVVALRLGPYRAYVVNHPDLIKQVFLDPRTYGRQTATYTRVRSILGMGLVTSEGDFWKRQRRIAQPAFHRERIAGFAEIMLRQAQAMVARWRSYAHTGAPFDVAEEMVRPTLQTACEALFGTDADGDVQAASHAFGELNRLITPHLHALVTLPLWVPTPVHRRVRRCIAQLDQTVYGLIARRRAQDAERPDLLSMLLRARDAETGESMSDLQLHDEVMTMLLAGHETTAVTMAWAIHLLSQAPFAVQRLTDELDAVLGGRPLRLADLERLPYARMVLDEALRLYPPLWGASRSVTADADLGGYRIPRDSVVLVAAYAVHRSPSLWTDPEAFQPERFDPQAAGAIHRYAYFPFLGGPRQCIGLSFAQMQMHILLAALAQSYHFSPVAGHVVEPEALITLRPRHGVKVTITERSSVPVAAGG